MPRIARAVASGLPHHIVQRGNNKEKVFRCDDDMKKYLSLLKDYSVKWDAPILAYCLMSNHVHILARPLRDESLCKMMQGVTLCFTQHVNRKYKRTGRLWESRYHSCIVDNERYLWAVARYVQQNPVRAKITKNAEDYQYSSARAHLCGPNDGTLGETFFEAGQRDDYMEFMRTSVGKEELDDIRNRTKSGRPIGSENFILKIERKLDRIFTAKPRGRPKKREVE
ncbi:MAG: transposase [Deltaproteobacteria bacterium]|nr:transposase [Deltaproteobacteria bacterium]